MVTESFGRNAGASFGLILDSFQQLWWSFQVYFYGFCVRITQLGVQYIDQLANE